MQVETYLSFEGCCEEAVEFYRRVLGAEVTSIMRFSQSPEPLQPGTIPTGAENKVMHMNFRIGDTTLMASDGHCQGKPNFQGFSLTLTAASDVEAERLFTALSEGGQVRMALAKTFFASKFGMITDRFGMSWMIVAMQ